MWLINCGYHLHLFYVHMKKHDGLLQFVCVQLFFTFDWNYLSWWHLHLLYIHTYESAPHFSSVCMCQFFGWTLTETNWMAPQSVHAHESTPLSFSFVCVNLFLLWLKPTQWHLHLLYIHMNQQHHTLVQFICINFLVLLWLKIYMSKYHQSQSETNFFLFGACLEQQLMLDRYNWNWSISVYMY